MLYALQHASGEFTQVFKNGVLAEDLATIKTVDELRGI